MRESPTSVFAEHMRRARRKGTWLGLISILILVGCSIKVLPSQLVTGSRYAIPHDKVTEEVRHHAERNQEYLDHLTQSESSGKELPGGRNICVALSGGGIRSAAFGIGVLRGLHTRKILEHVDVISGTSGGAYALTWYYMQHYDVPQGQTPNIFGEHGGLDDLVEHHSHFYRSYWYVPVGVGNVLLSPLNLLFNGLFGAHLNTSWFGLTYDHAIKETFHGGHDVRIADLKKTIRDHSLPYFVISATARLDEDNNHQDALFGLTIFEFTPSRWGSGAYGYSDLSEEFRLKEAVSIAGSAPDSTAIFAGASQRVFGSALNFDVGRFIPNTSETYAREKKQHPVRNSVSYVVPFPLYFLFPEYYRHAAGRQIYLSDGGHQENLAAFPLIRRLCGTIIIVDGDADPEYQFEDYFKLKHGVEREMGVAFELRPIRVGGLGYQDVDSLDCDPSTRLAGESVAGRCGREEPGKSKGPAEPKASCSGSPEGGRVEPLGEREASRVTTFNPCLPVMEGGIGSFPVVEDGKVAFKNLKVILVKLSVPFGDNPGALKLGERERFMAQYGTAFEYYHAARENRCQRGDIIQPCEFPHISTKFQSFSAAQFRAYVDLGSAMVCRHLEYRAGVLEVKYREVSFEECVPRHSMSLGK